MEYKSEGSTIKPISIMEQIDNQIRLNEDRANKLKRLKAMIHTLPELENTIQDTLYMLKGM